MEQEVNNNKAEKINDEITEIVLPTYWRKSTTGRVVFNHVLLAQELFNKNDLIWFAGELYLYKNGLYVKGARNKLAAEIQNALGLESNKQRKAEVLDWINTEAKQINSQANNNLYIINTLNGLYNIQTQEFTEHTPEYHSTIQIPVKYDPDAECPEIIEFLKSVVPVDSVDFVFEWFGYALLRDYKFSKALMLYGTGGNGKSIFIQLFNSFLGKENISAVDLHSLEKNRFAPSRLFGKLANTFADIDSAYLETSKMIKSLTGNDDIVAEFKNKDLFEFKNFAKLMFSANKLPSFKDTSEGNFDRWIILPFPNRFRGTGNENIHLLNQLTTDSELSGLLNYALKGLNHLLEERKFSISPSMLDQIGKWKNQVDSVLLFIDDEDVIIKGQEKFVEKKILYSEYKFWCNENGFKPMKVTNFYDRMAHHGYQEKQMNNSLGRKRIYRGLDIIDKF